MAKQQLLIVILSLFFVSSPFIISANAEIEFMQPNILDYASYNQTGVNTVFSNSTGIYINGTGTTLIKMNDYNGSSIHFNQENFDRDDYFYGMPNENTSPFIPAIMNVYFDFYSCVGVDVNLQNITHKAIYTPNHLEIYDWHTFSKTTCDWAIPNVPEHYEDYDSPDNPPFYERDTLEFTLDDIAYDIFLFVTPANPDEVIHLRAEEYIPNPSQIQNITSSVFNDHIILDWLCPIYDGIGYLNECSNISNYNVLRDGTSISNTTSTTFDDYSIEYDTTYIYSIIATNTNDYDSLESSLSIISLDVPHSPELDLIHNGDSITISWSDPYPETIQYKIKRVETDYIWDVPVTQTSLIDDDDISLSGTYSYQIQSRTAIEWLDWSPIYDISYYSSSDRELTVTTESNFDYVSLSPIIIAGLNGAGDVTAITATSDQRSDIISYDLTVEDDSQYTLDTFDIQYETTPDELVISANFTSGDNPIYILDDIEPIQIPDFTLSNYDTQEKILADSTLKYNVIMDATPFDVSCLYADLSGTQKWFNQTNIDTYYSLYTNSTSSKIYIDCYSDDVLLFSESLTNDETLYGLNSLKNLDVIFGDFAGVSLPLLFVIFVASIFTAKNAHMGILIIGITIGIMVALGLLSIDPLMWGLIVLLVILGLFAGKKS